MIFNEIIFKSAEAFKKGVIDSIDDQFSDDKFDPANPRFNKPGEIRRGSGKLIDSIRRDSFASVQNENIIVTIKSDLPYAKIQNEGGFISSPTFIENNRKKSKMSKFFWAMWYKYSAEYWKILAFAAIKNGGVNIPAKHFIEKGFKAYQEKRQKSWFENIFIKRVQLEFDKQI